MVSLIEMTEPLPYKTVDSDQMKAVFGDDGDYIGVRVLVDDSEDDPEAAMQFHQRGKDLMAAWTALIAPPHNS